MELNLFFTMYTHAMTKFLQADYYSALDLYKSSLRNIEECKENISDYEKIKKSLENRIIACERLTDFK